MDNEEEEKGGREEKRERLKHKIQVQSSAPNKLSTLSSLKVKNKKIKETKKIMC